ncbi:MAG: MFS transporter [Clostridia bacterium]|nr:MFS transporter [Clostridia bacterium]
MKKIAIRRHVWSLLWVGWVAVALSQVLSFGYGMMVPDIMRAFQLDYTQIGLVGSVTAWVSVAANIPISGLAAKANPKYALPVIYLLVGAGCLIFGIAPALPWLYAGRILSGAAGAGLISALVVVKMRWVPSSRMEEVNGIENFVQPIGQTFATLFMAPLMALLAGWRGVYFAVGALMLLCALLWLPAFSRVNRQIAPIPTSAKQHAKEESVFGALKQALSKPMVLLYAVAYPGKILIWIGFFYYFPSFFMEVRGFTAAQAGLATGLFPVFSAIASILSPRIAARFKLNKSLLVGSGLLLCIGYYAMLQISSLPVICIVSAVTGFLSYIATPVYFTNMYRLGLTPKGVQMATSVLLTMVSVGSALGAGIVGRMIDTLGFEQGLLYACFTPLWFSFFTALSPNVPRGARSDK